ncbi:MAG: MoaD/ThiS family protein [Peptococcales bacterium]
MESVEIRCFSFLKKLCDERNLPFPFYYELDGQCTAEELARKVDLPLEKIEAVFINGSAYPIDAGVINPGDRVAFIPPGTPGPYRALLGMVKIKGDNSN